MKTIMLVCPLARTFNFREQLINKLCRLNYHVVLLSENGPEIEKFLESGCEFKEIHMDRRGKNIFNDGRLIRDYYCVIKDIKPNVVLLYTTKCSIYGGMVCRMLNIPYIVNNAGLIESTGAFSYFLNILYRIGFAGATCMMYQNKQEQHVVQKLLKGKTHFRNIPGSGVDILKYQYTEYPTGDIVVFDFVARVIKIKGIDEYLECAKQVHQKYPQTLFRIYGTLDDDYYREKVMDYEKKSYVKYCGQKSDMRSEIASSSAVIHPSYYEGMTNVVLEHSAMGRPCLGSNIPGVEEAIENGETGYVFEVRNIHDICNKVSRFIELPFEDKVQMGKKARKKMEKEFSREIVTDIYLEEIHNILGK